ncbi:MAG: hypothetical protein JKY65_11695 [Planctomycetes bacterium]|nr:hypothetical protein [Planctomycetota bacterium]
MDYRTLRGAGPLLKTTLWCAPLAFGLMFAGCSGGSSGGGGSAASTATGVTTATTTTVVAAPTNPIPQAPASVGVPLDVFNREIQTLWDGVRPQIVMPSLNDLLATQLQGKKYSSGAIEVELRNVRLGPATNMNVAPGLLRLDTKQLEIRAPVQGKWALVLEADIRVQLSVGSLTPAIDLPVTIAIEDLWLSVAADLDDSDPTRPVLQRAGAPQLDFTVRFDSTNSIVQQLTGALNQPVNWIAQQAVTLGLNSIMPQLSSIQGIPGPIPGDGAAPLVDSGRNTPFEEVVKNIDLKLHVDNMPHGTVMVAAMDTADTETWLDAYRQGGPGNTGAVIDYHSGGDSAIWTGHFLAAQAFRYSVTQDSLALDSIGHSLKGIGALLDVNGGSGLLARVAAPEASFVGQNISRRGVFRSAQLYGERWVGRQGSKGISRDQYSGVMFGLSITYELVPALRTECAFRIQQMVDYLIRNNWSIDEDRPQWNGTNGSRGPTFWTGINYQKLAFLLMAHRTDPAKYATALAEAGPLSESAWLGLWTSTFGTDHYYKFNLAHIGLYNYFRLETDPNRWQDLRRAYAITERYVGHHRNPHFDLIQGSIDPSTQAVKNPSIREAIRQLMDMPHREIGPAVVDLSAVQWVNLSTFSYSNTSGGGFSVGGQTSAFPTEPLDVFLRRPTGHFQWQRDPFSPATANAGNAKAERVGLGLTLPYWMGRAQGAF